MIIHSEKKDLIFCCCCCWNNDQMIMMIKSKYLFVYKENFLVCICCVVITINWRLVVVVCVCVCVLFNLIFFACGHWFSKMGHVMIILGKNTGSYWCWIQIYLLRAYLFCYCCCSFIICVFEWYADNLYILNDYEW